MFNNQALRETQAFDRFRLAHQTGAAVFVQHIAARLPDPIDPGATPTTDDARASATIAVSQRDGLFQILVPGQAMWMINAGFVIDIGIEPGGVGRAITRQTPELILPAERGDMTRIIVFQVDIRVRVYIAVDRHQDAASGKTDREAVHDKEDIGSCAGRELGLEQLQILRSITARQQRDNWLESCRSLR